MPAEVALPRARAGRRFVVSVHGSSTFSSICATRKGKLQSTFLRGPIVLARSLRVSISLSNDKRHLRPESRSEQSLSLATVAFLVRETSCNSERNQRESLRKIFNTSVTSVIKFFYVTRETHFLPHIVKSVSHNYVEKEDTR